MSDRTNNKNSSRLKTRRALLGGIAAAGAAATRLPEQWQRPVVDHVLLPVHANLSAFTGTQCAVTFTENVFREISGTTTGSGTYTVTSTQFISASRDWDGAFESFSTSAAFTSFFSSGLSTSSTSFGSNSSQILSGASSSQCSRPLSNILF